jgi:hypothetical protein
VIVIQLPGSPAVKATRSPCRDRRGEDPARSAVAAGARRRTGGPSGRGPGTVVLEALEAPRTTSAHTSSVSLNGPLRDAGPAPARRPCAKTSEPVELTG